MNVLQKLKNSAKALKTEVSAIYLSLNDKRTPLFAKVMVIFTVCYALSPIDLIPDFIPILGYLDDLIILPILIAASILRGCHYSYVDRRGGVCCIEIL